ncbi:TatD family hydrolase [candidate division WOR-3 bacterium]|nr:TatD family hydrolase [candidate division WOR-3 bacterium]
MNFKICDSHCHLQDRRFRGEVEEVIRSARESGVEKILVPGWDLRSSREAVVISEKFDDVYSACGVHPHDAKFYNDSVEREIIKLSKSKNVVSIGEIGLDYYRDLSPRNVQKDVFERQLRVAEENDLPVIIHTRDSIEDTIEIVTRFNCKGVFHAFDYTKNFAMKIIEMGYFIGVGGVVTYPNSKIFSSIKEIPLTSVLVETDAPYLTPQPHRGRRNEPSYTKYVVKKIAELKSKSFEEVAEKTYNNTKKLFGI